MQGLYDGLVGIGVRESRIHYESFGPATLLKSAAPAVSAPAEARSGEAPVTVRFDSADQEVPWAPEKGTLLDLAESAGLSPAYACRSGICGSCATRIICGSVDYIEEPVGPRGADEVLICCATPRTLKAEPGGGETGCGDDVGVVLDL